MADYDTSIHASITRYQDTVEGMRDLQRETYRDWLRDTARSIATETKPQGVKDLNQGIKAAKDISKAVLLRADKSPWIRLGAEMLIISPEAARHLLPAARFKNAMDTLSYNGNGWREHEVAYIIVRQDLEAALYDVLADLNKSAFATRLAELATAIVTASVEKDEANAASDDDDETDEPVKPN